MKNAIARLLSATVFLALGLSLAHAVPLGTTMQVFSQCNFQGGAYGYVWMNLTAPNGTVYSDPTYPRYGTITGQTHYTTIILNQVGTWTVNQWADQSSTHRPVPGTGYPQFITVTANTYTIAISSSPSNGGTTTGAGTFTATTATVTATVAAGGWTFKRWTESGAVANSNGAGTANSSYSFTGANRTLVAEFNPPAYLTLTPSVTGSGTINPPAPTQYLAGTFATVTASPGTGYYLSSYGGTANPGGTPGSFNVKMDSGKTIAANFLPNNYTLSTATNGSGSGTVSGAGTYSYGSTATVTATPSPGSYFASFSDGGAQTHGIAMNGNNAVTATFWPNSYTLSTATNGSGSGTVSGGGTYTYGQTPTVTANPSTGSYFGGFSDGGAQSHGITMSGDKSVTATFWPNTYTVNLTAMGSGTASGGGSYTYNQTANLRPTPSAGYYFTGWAGDISGSTVPYTLTVVQNYNITANFAIYTYPLTTNTAGNGRGSISGAGTYNYSSTATSSASASPGSYFTGWSNAATGTTNPVGISMTSPQTLTATFMLNSYSLTTNTAGTGSGGVTAGTTSNYGTTQCITATPSAGSTFAGWSGAATGTTNPLTITMDANKFLTAKFTLNTYPLTTNTTGAGSGTVSGAGTYNYGSTATSTATASTGSTFAGWSGAATGATNPISFAMTSDQNLTAGFTLNSYTLTTAASGIGTETAGGSYPYGTNIAITATPGTGQVFSSWSGAATGTANPVTITIDSNKTLTATFTPIKYTLTTATSGSGSVTPGGTYPYGTTHAITATPATGQAFAGWSGAFTGIVNPVTITTDADKTLTAQFTPINYTVSTAVSPAAGGSLAGSGVFPYGTTMTLTATPATGYTFAGFTGGIVASTNPSSLTVTGDATVTANFDLISYTLTTGTSGAGSGSVSGGASYPYGTHAAATATPSTGSSFSGWSNAATGTTNPVSVTMTNNQTLTATFVLKAYTVSTNVVGVGSVTGGGNYNFGQTTTMTATAGTGYTFAGWSGALSGLTTPQSLLVDADKIVSATFSANSYTLGITTVGSGSATGAGNYTYGQTATLVATPATGYLFSGFSGAITSPMSPATLLIDTNKLATATFVRHLYALTTQVSGSGSVTPGGNYNAPDPSIIAVTLVAAPSGLTRFTGYTGSIAGTIATVNADGSASLYVPMTMDRAVVANFASRLSQIITFAAMGAHAVSETFADLSATATSGLPVAFTVISGPGTVSGSRLTFTGTGTIIVQASQGGNFTYLPAIPVQLNASIVASPVTTLKEDGGPSKINNGEKEAGNFRPGT